MNQAELQQELVNAMKAGDAVRLSVLRNIKSEVKNEAIKLMVPELNADQVGAVVKRLVKQLKDSRVDFEKAGRTDLVEKNKVEVAILENFLPPAMDEATLKALIVKKRDEMGVKDAAGKGKLMGAVMKEAGGLTDGALVKRMVDELCA